MIIIIINNDQHSDRSWTIIWFQTKGFLWMNRETVWSHISLLHSLQIQLHILFCIWVWQKGISKYHKIILTSHFWTMMVILMGLLFFLSLSYIYSYMYIIKNKMKWNTISLKQYYINRIYCNYLYFVDSFFQKLSRPEDFSLRHFKPASNI